MTTAIPGWVAAKADEQRVTTVHAVQSYPRLTFRDRALLLILFVNLAAVAFDGALRYVLSGLGLPFLVYLPKVLVLLACIGVVLQMARTLRVRRRLFGACIVLILYLFVGVYFTHHVEQALVGGFILVPLFFGVLVAPAVTKFGDRIVPYAFTLWCCVAAGIIYSHFVDVPWSGVQYTVAGYAMDTSREWSTFGINRVAGFSRASFSAAIQCLFLALPIVMFSKHFVLSSLIWMSTGVLILLTTTKTTLGVYVFMTLMLPVVSSSVFSRRFKRMVSVAVPALITLVGVVMPFSTLFTNYKLSLDSPASDIAFASFGDRLDQMWPDTFKLVFKHGSILFGRGIGGIGTAQSYFEKNLYLAADNMYLYLYAMFGLFAMVLIWLYLTKICKLSISRDRWSLFLWTLGVAVLMEGWTVNVIESAYLAIVLGLTFGVGAAANKRAIQRPTHVQGRFGI